MAFSRYILAIEVEDKPGVMTRISSLFSRRGFNVESLTVGHTQQVGVSRFTIVVYGDEKELEQIRKQSQKLIHVLKTSHLEPEQAILRELALVKIEAKEEYSSQFFQLVDEFKARLLDHSDGCWVVEVSGHEKRISQFFEQISGMQILEALRSGQIGVGKGQILKHDKQSKTKDING